VEALVWPLALSPGFRGAVRVMRLVWPVRRKPIRSHSRCSGPGRAGIYTMSDAAFKIFINRAAYEVEGGNGAWPFRATTLCTRRHGSINLARAAARLAQVRRRVRRRGALTTGVLRAIHHRARAQMGVQARFPWI